MADLWLRNISRRDFMKGIMVGGVAAGSAGLLAACGSSSSTTSSSTSQASTSETESTASSSATEESAAQTSTEGARIEVDGNYIFDKIIGSSMGDGGTFDPFALGSWGNCIVGDLIFQRLANIDPYGELHYCMMKSVEEIDETHYQIEIWDNIYDTAGNHITASDVAWSYEEGIANGRGGAVSKLDHFEVVDDYNVIWVCTSAFTIGEFDKQISTLQVLSQASYEAAGETGMSANPVGTGPYILESYVPGSTLTFIANEDYWMRNLPEETKAELWMYDAQNVETIEYQIIQDASTRAIALEMGTIDIADNLDNADVDAMEGDEAYSVIEMPQTAPYAALFNCDPQSICSNVLIREAICYALDTEAIADGVSVPAQAAECLLPLQVDTPDEWLEEEYFDYNLEKAQELMDEAGYTGETIKIIYGSSVPQPDIVIMMQSQLQSAGFNVEIEAMDMTLLSNASSDPSAYDIRLMMIGGGYYIANAMNYFTVLNAETSIGEGKNIMFVVDDELESLIQEENRENSLENILALGDYINENCYVYSILTYSNRTLCTSELDSTAMYGGKIAPNAAVSAE